MWGRSLLFSPFSSRPLSEVLLGKLQHVVLAVVQRSLIQVSVDKPIQRNSLLIQKAVITEVPFYFITLAGKQMQKKKKKAAPLWFDQFRGQPLWTPRLWPQRRTPRTDPLLPAALLFCPAAATGSPGLRLGGRTQPGRSRSG